MKEKEEEEEEEDGEETMKKQKRRERFQNSINISTTLNAATKLFVWSILVSSR